MKPQKNNPTISVFEVATVATLLLSPDLAQAASLRLSLAKQTASVEVRVTGPTNALVALERSQDLRSWQRLATNVLTAGWFAQADPNPGLPERRFYRAVQLPPAAPSWLSAAFDGSNLDDPKVRLCWTIPPGTEYVTVERKTNGQASFEWVYDVEAPASCYDDWEIAADQSYIYRLTACFDLLCSTPSVLTNVAVPKPPAPTGLSAVPWFDSTDRSIYVTVCWTPLAATNYTVDVERLDPGTNVWEWANFAGWPDNCITDMVFSAGITYSYQAIVRYIHGDSPRSVEIPVFIPVPAPLLDAPVTDNPLVVELSWSNDLDNETEYQVQRAEGAGTFQTIANPPTDESCYSDYPPVGSSYRYRIVTCVNGVCSPPSNEMTAAPLLGPTTPTSPINGATGVHRPTTHTWNAVPSANRYRIQTYKASDSSLVDVGVVAAPNVSYLNGGLSGATRYMWRIRAETGTGTGTGPWSAFAYFTTN